MNIKWSQKNIWQFNIHSWPKKKKKKPLRVLRIEGNFLNLIKGIYWKKSIANIILISERLMLSPNIGNMPRTSSQCNKSWKRKKKKKKAPREQTKNKTDLIHGNIHVIIYPQKLLWIYKKKIPRTRILEFKISIQN